MSARLALITPGYHPEVGGVETHVQRLAAGMVARGHAVEVVTQSRRGAAEAPQLEDGVRVTRLARTWDHPHFGFSIDLHRYLKEHRATWDLVHAHNYHALPALAATVAGCRPLVFTPHYHARSASRLRNGLHRIYKVFGRRILTASERVICVSPSEARLLTRAFPAAGPRVRVVPNGVDSDRLRTGNAEPRSMPTIVTAGRLERYKRVDRLLAATALMPDIQVVVAGAGPERTALENQAAALGLASRVRFTGFVDDRSLHQLYRSAAAFVSLSEHEAFGLTACEAAVAGTPVVVSAIPAHVDAGALIGRQGFFLVEPECDASGLAQAIRAAISSDPPTAEGVPDWSDVVDRTLEVYAEALPGWER